MSVEPVIGPSARKRGLTDEEILHAFYLHRWEFPMDDGFTMVVGPDYAGNPLEVGFVEAEDGTIVIIHAMPARPKFLR